MFFMKRNNQQPVDLKKAQSLIIEECCSLPEEHVDLAESINRYPTSALLAREPLPGYDQSLRDGYAIGPLDSKCSKEQGDCCFQVIDEVAAGDTRQLTLRPGEAIRIMTGGLVPKQCGSVVPQEFCEIATKTIKVPSRFLDQKKLFVHVMGSELAKGRVVVPKGTPIRPEQQILLAGVGYDTVQVVRKPRISFFCTGSELVTGTELKPAGKKFSANTHLLHGLIELAGADLLEKKTVKDDPGIVAMTIAEMSRSQCDIMISTGGMGPGKFDLIEEAFADIGGRVVYRSLLLRPGKSTLFGMLGKTLFFGMPGPPPAVHLLFNELIRPAVLALQGAKHCRPRKLKAYLSEDLYLPKRGLPRLKSGVLQVVDGRCVVRAANRIEPSNCHIYCFAARRRLRKGEKVLIHLQEPLDIG